MAHRHLPILLALSLLGCPPAREMLDAGETEDASSLDATDQRDTDHHRRHPQDILYGREAPSLERCNGIDDDCNGVVDDLASLATDRFNCGVCGNVCAETYRCVDGACVCPPGQAFCRTVSPWCIDVRANPAHCGRCGVTCASGSTCVDGLCT